MNDTMNATNDTIIVNTVYVVFNSFTKYVFCVNINAIQMTDTKRETLFIIALFACITANSQSFGNSYTKVISLLFPLV